MKKPTPKKTIALANSPTRDEKALIFSISAIKTGKNVRDKLENIEELAASIKSTGGLLQPLVITKSPGGGFELIAGRRRLAALILLGEKTAPVRLVGADASQIATMRVVENLQRENLTPLETVCAIESLGKKEFKTQRELARAIGKTESYVSQCMAVAKLLEEKKLQRVEVEGLPLRELFARLSNKGGTRKPAGAIPGGRYVTNALQFKDRGGTFSLRLNYAAATPIQTKLKIIETLKEILKRLEQPQSAEVANGS